MAKKKRAAKKKPPPRDRDIPLSLYGLTFEEVLADVMQVKPPPREPKRKKRASRD